MENMSEEALSFYNQQFLLLKLKRVDVFIRRAARCWQMAGQDPQDQFRGLMITHQEADQIARQAIGTTWGHMVSLPPEEEAQYAGELEAVNRQEAALMQTCQQQGLALQIHYLQQAFRLDEVDLDILLICLAPALDPRYERLYSYLQDDVTRKQPGVNLLLVLLGEPGLGRLELLAHISPDAPLFQAHLVEFVNEAANSAKNLLARELQVDPTLVVWLLGRYEPRPELYPHAHLFKPKEEEIDRLLSAPLDQGVNMTALPGYGGTGAPALVFYGPDQAGQEAAARRCAAQMQSLLLRVNLAGLVEDGLTPKAALRAALRDALLLGALPYLCGWEACLNGQNQAAGAARLKELLEEVDAYPGVAIIAAQTAWQAAGLERLTPLFWLEFPIPPYAQRAKIWQYYLAALVGEPQAQAIEVSALAGQFILTSGQIRDAITTARDRAMQRGQPPGMDDLLAAAREHSNPHLGTLARKLNPRYTRQDIVLPEDPLRQIGEIVSTVKERARVLSEWGLGRKLVASAGVTILFTGESGTGKTMAAEVIASELGLDLYKIDLSTLVSKYIGETEKNLEQIFHEAESSNAILFFDEADAIFGKRSEVKDAHDRYANIEVSYLLQRMEDYDGVTILATNLRSNLDQAFTRRLQFLVDFPPPDEYSRLRIWQTLFPPDVPRATDLDFGLLARRFKLAGGNIRNILVSAAYLAASDGGAVRMEHLLHGARRELQKMGRHINETDMVVK